jgi:hypothetical protein
MRSEKAMTIAKSSSPLEPAIEALGFDPAIHHKLLAGIESGLLRDLHVVLAARSGMSSSNITRKASTRNGVARSAMSRSMQRRCTIFVP